MLEVEKMYFRSLAHAIRRRVRDDKAVVSLDGWRIMGSGHFSLAFKNDNFPGMIVKVSGPAGFGKWMPNGTGVDSKDAYAEWAQLCLKYQGVPGIPKIYMFEAISPSINVAVVAEYEVHTGYAVVTTPPLHILLYRLSFGTAGKDPLDRVAYAAAGATTQAEVDMLLDVACLLDREDVTADYHGDNFMLDAEGCVISTDPLCYVHGYNECV